MAAFSQLPTELVEFIASYLAQQDLYAISRVNKSLNTLVGPYLYQHVDLVIQAGEKMPRIDRFCQNILNDPRRAARIESLRLGPSSEEGVKEGQRWLPRDKCFDDEAMYQKALTVLDNEPLIASGDYLRDAILQREYSAYAVLIVLAASALQQLDISDFKYSTMDRLHTILRNLDAERPWNERHASPALLERLTRITAVSCNVDRRAGHPYPVEKGHVYLDQVLNLPGLKKLEFSVTDTQAMMGRAFNPAGMTHWPSRLLTTRVQPTALTKMIVRHSTSSALAVRPLLGCTPQLLSFSWDIAYDCRDRNEAPEHWIDLDAWNTSLRAVSKTLEILVLAAEYFDSGKFSFEQPKIGARQFGYLDLTGFERLHTLEVPIPFLTGDVDFSITADIYPLLPPYLRHLSLRVDLSLAQLSYQLDTSILSTGLTLQQSQAEARCAMSARMDLSYTYHATIAILDHAPALESISVWQPADPSLAWFDGQVADFATTCSNKSVTGIMLYPMLLRWGKSEHRDLVKEIRLESAKADRFERLCRGERMGIPLGLASQFHLHALRSHLIRRR
ncbi:hypothetical protein E8E12_003888 [Didymella heteroderae]|uniref:F-box domain-containing protein n=1 Tax=Didymella heteroderae TaxID=1769908 RepID=A0A9P5C1N8_9PLEO|nr:hypothetical protein E8E12_003888 [Didymella heteroderae]